MTDIKQFIMANGDEIVCEVLEWASYEDPDMVVRRAYKVVTVDDPYKGIRYFTLRPWMIYQSGEEIFNTINSTHIISEANPRPQLLHQYNMTIAESEKNDEEFEEKVNEVSKKIDSLLNNINTDSSSDNIIYFGNKDKLH